MSEDNNSQPEINLKTTQKRRVRADKQNRDYKCSCGKSYLSYPALYTHVKNKHSEEAAELLKKPGGIQKPTTTALTRGRPKFSNQQKIQQNQQNNLEFNSLSILEILIIELVDIFKTMDQFKGKTIVLVANNVLNQQEVQDELKLVQEFVILDLLPSKSQNLVLKKSLKILAIHFVKLLSKHFSAYVYAKILLFFSILIHCYNNSNYSKSEPEDNNIDSHFFNDFMTDLYEQYKKKANIKIWESQPIIFQKLIQAFGNWMHLNGFINHRFCLNDE